MWSSEADATDAFTPLAMTAVWAPTLRLGTAIVPAFTRGPGLLKYALPSATYTLPFRTADKAWISARAFSRSQSWRSQVT